MTLILFALYLVVFYFCFFWSVGVTVCGGFVGGELLSIIKERNWTKFLYRYKMKLKSKPQLFIDFLIAFTVSVFWPIFVALFLLGVVVYLFGIIAVWLWIIILRVAGK